MDILDIAFIIEAIFTLGPIAFGIIIGIGLGIAWIAKKIYKSKMLRKGLVDSGLFKEKKD